MAPLFNAKAAKWVSGRKNIFQRLEQAIGPGKPVIWMHCSSLGEFEQGRPVLEKLRETRPGHRILLTFFSPSGYEVRKDYAGADWVFYLPMDGPRNAGRFLDIVQPELVIFVKYEFWYYYLKKIHYRKIPLLLISARFYEGAFFFRWYGAIGRKMLTRFNHIFLQNETSLSLLQQNGLDGNASVCGDTRFDRVIRIASEAKPVPWLENFAREGFIIVAGSTWPDDEQVLSNALKAGSGIPVKLVIAPHEIHEAHLQLIGSMFPDSIRYSLVKADTDLRHVNVLIIDNFGMLSSIYRYGTITYLGGGYTRTGIHNVLEAAVYDKVVCFGPNHEGYSEAVGLVAAGGAHVLNDPEKKGMELAELIRTFHRDKARLQAESRAAGGFVRSQQGATEKILHYIQENRLLTS